MSGLLSYDSREASLFWKIRHFLNLQDIIQSRKFSFSDCGVPEFSLHCYSRATIRQVGVYVCLFLYCSSHSTLSFEFSIIGREGTEPITKNVTNHLFKSNYVGWVEIMDRDTLLEDYLPEGTLTVRCTVKQDSTAITETTTGPIAKCSILAELSKSLKTLHLSEAHHDVTIKVSNNMFPAHKNILSARSPVFNAMLSHNMEESNKNMIVISDISDNVVKEMLEYIYTGVSPNLDNMPEDLLAAADKYDLEALKQMCASSIMKTITPNNVCERYLLSYFHNMEDLARDIEKFACSNMQSIMETDTFEEMMAAYPGVLRKLLLSQYRN